MEHRNTVLFQSDMRERARERENDEMPLLIDRLAELIPEQQELLDEQFVNTCNLITVGYAMFLKALQITGRTTFRPAMRRFPTFQALTDPVKKKIYDIMIHIKHIMKYYDRIVFNITRPTMQYLDVRRLSVEQISRCSNEKWANDYNKLHMPKELRRHDKEYFQYQIDDIIANVPGSTNRLLEAVYNNEEQIQLIGKDITKALLAKGRSALLNEQS